MESDRYKTLIALHEKLLRLVKSGQAMREAHGHIADLTDIGDGEARVSVEIEGGNLVGLTMDLADLVDGGRSDVLVRRARKQIVARRKQHADDFERELAEFLRHAATTLREQTPDS